MGRKTDMDSVAIYSLAVIVATCIFNTTVPATDWLWQVTTDPAGDRDPSWSPDGTTIAFYSDRSGNNDIWVIPVEGGTPTQITTYSGYDALPSWSPDGASIAFTSFRDGNRDIWTIPAVGGTPTRITTDPANDARPSWSPDCTAIAFDSYRTGNDDIWVIIPEHTVITPASLGEVKAMFR
jgi:Tol biopolymer transport system component